MPIGGPPTFLLTPTIDTSGDTRPYQMIIMILQSPFIVATTKNAIKVTAISNDLSK